MSRYLQDPGTEATFRLPQHLRESLRATSSGLLHNQRIINTICEDKEDCETKQRAKRAAKACEAAAVLLLGIENILEFPEWAEDYRDGVINNLDNLIDSVQLPG